MQFKVIYLQIYPTIFVCNKPEKNYFKQKFLIIVDLTVKIVSLNYGLNC